MSSQSISLYNLLAKKKLFKKTINFDLKRIKLALTKLENPERKLKNVINFIGSDGKYSVLNSLRANISRPVIGKRARNAAAGVGTPLK